MGRNPMAEIPSQASEDNGDLSFHTVRGSSAGFPVKRNHHLDNLRNNSDGLGRRRWRPRSHLFRGGRKGIQMKGTSLFYATIVAAVFIFLVAAAMLQSSMTAGLRSGRESRRSLRGGFMIGSSLRFRMSRRYEMQVGRLDQLRMEGRSGIRPPTLAIVLGSMKKDPLSLMLLSVMKNLQKLHYVLKIYAIEDDEAHPLWDQIGCRVSILGPESASYIDWSIYDGVVLSSLEAKEAISSLMQEPFCSVPIIWIVQEDTLGKRLSLYKEVGWDNLIIEWRHAFSRADVVVFPDYTLPMLYSVLDTGNFFVISGSPVDVWSAEQYIELHSKNQLMTENGFHEDDLVIVVIGASLFYNELPWDYAVSMQAIGPLLTKSMRTKDLRGSFKIVFLCGNSTDDYRDALREIASRLGFPDGSVSHYGMDVDVNRVLLMADIVLYSSFQEEQGFPSLLIRAMSFGVPIIAPDLAVIKRHVLDGVHGMIFRAHSPDTLTRALSVLVSDMKLSKFAHVVASSGKLLSRNMLASECITGYAKLLEGVLQFPSDTMLPLPVSISQFQQYNWEWNLFRKAKYERGNEVIIHGFDDNSSLMRKTSIVYVLEDELVGENLMRNTSAIETETALDQLTQRDWDELRAIENSEEIERLELEELEERMEKPSQSWDEIYRNARKAEKLKFEAYERDEGELERIGQLLCIYEIYSGAGSWPFLHHGALYRGLSLSTRARRSRSDDVDAVSRLPFLNDTHYRDLLCEAGGMFSIAKRVDSIHKMPWIGFQSWRAVGRKVSLSTKAENILEETLQVETKGDIFYFWAQTDIYNRENTNLSFWSLCDILNGGNCRSVFENTFRQMYGLPLEMAALPPMPGDGHLWSALNSWALPTPSFLEFIMFSRMFVDSLDRVNHNLSNPKTCLLGSSKLQEKHCYCQMLELLVNVWAYHSARKLVYIDPISGTVEERHPIEGRKGLMWVKYFDFTLLKSMDEDLAEEADDESDDHDHPNNRWLWPLTGEVHWQGIYEREREERYRQKMDKKRKTKEKLLERQRYGYKQKSLGA